MDSEPPSGAEARAVVTPDDARPRRLHPVAAVFGVGVLLPALFEVDAAQTLVILGVSQVFLIGALSTLLLRLRRWILTSLEPKTAPEQLERR